MRIGIVGASGAGIYAALLWKAKHPKDDVFLFDKEERVGRKLLATGNGRCNLLNSHAKGKDYNHPQKMDLWFARHPIEELRAVLSSLGLMLRELDDGLVYPYSLSSKSYVLYLEKLLNRFDISVRLGRQIVEYEGTSLLFSDGKKEAFDRLIFATGGKSQANLGSDGSLFPLFEKHGYKINPLMPGLAPIYTKEKTKSISGSRVKGVVRCKAYHVDFEEEGEILFKDRGLSGIAIFNLSSVLARAKAKEASIVLDLFPSLTVEELKSAFEDSYLVGQDDFLLPYFDPSLAAYLKQRTGPIKNKDDLGRTAYLCKNLTFTYDGNYGFDSSQVTIGGIDLGDLDENLSSKKEEGISFCGEVVDIEGKCGGFNLTWCLLSALLATKSDKDYTCFKVFL